eukprot:6964709-Alexandrium_andersonii.AAC.1
MTTTASQLAVLQRMDSATEGASAPRLAGGEASGGACHPRANVHSGRFQPPGLNGSELSELSAFGAFKL